MKINPIANPNILRNYQAAKLAPERTKVLSGRDEVIFSDEALEFSKALEEAREALEFRTPEEKSYIAGITNAIRQGEYKVDSGLVADKILESVLGKR